MGICQSKKRCKICSSKNKDNRQHICEECSFIPHYITRYGRENLKRILNNSYKEYEIPININDTLIKNHDKTHKNNISEILTLNQPSAPLSSESTTDDFLQRSSCKSINCNCKNRNTNFRNSNIYNPPSYPTN